MSPTSAQKQATDRYRAKNGRAQVNIELTPEDRQRWQAYAQARDMSLTAVVRECVARCMAEDSFAPGDHAGMRHSDTGAVSAPAPAAGGRCTLRGPCARSGASKAWRAWIKPLAKRQNPCYNALAMTKNNARFIALTQRGRHAPRRGLQAACRGRGTFASEPFL